MHLDFVRKTDTSEDMTEHFYTTHIEQQCFDYFEADISLTSIEEAVQECREECFTEGLVTEANLEQNEAFLEWARTYWKQRGFGPERYIHVVEECYS